MYFHVLWKLDLLWVSGRLKSLELVLCHLAFVKRIIFFAKNALIRKLRVAINSKIVFITSTWASSSQSELYHWPIIAKNNHWIFICNAILFHRSVCTKLSLCSHLQSMSAYQHYTQSQAYIHGTRTNSFAKLRFFHSISSVFLCFCLASLFLCFDKTLRTAERLWNFFSACIRFFAFRISLLSVQSPFWYQRKRSGDRIKAK